MVWFLTQVLSELFSNTIPIDYSIGLVEHSSFPCSVEPTPVLSVEQLCLQELLRIHGKEQEPLIDSAAEQSTTSPTVGSTDWIDSLDIVSLVPKETPSPSFATVIQSIMSAEMLQHLSFDLMQTANDLQQQQHHREHLLSKIFSATRLDLKSFSEMCDDDLPNSFPTGECSSTFSSFRLDQTATTLRDSFDSISVVNENIDEDVIEVDDIDDDDDDDDSIDSLFRDVHSEDGQSDSHSHSRHSHSHSHNRNLNDVDSENDDDEGEDWFVFSAEQSQRHLSRPSAATRTSPLPLLLRWLTVAHTLVAVTIVRGLLDMRQTLLQEQQQQHTDDDDDDMAAFNKSVDTLPWMDSDSTSIRFVKAPSHHHLSSQSLTPSTKVPSLARAPSFFTTTATTLPVFSSHLIAQTVDRLVAHRSQLSATLHSPFLPLSPTAKWRTLSASSQSCSKLNRFSPQRSHSIGNDEESVTSSPHHAHTHVHAHVSSESALEYTLRYLLDNECFSSSLQVPNPRHVRPSASLSSLCRQSLQDRLHSPDTRDVFLQLRLFCQNTSQTPSQQLQLQRVQHDPDLDRFQVVFLQFLSTERWRDLGRLTIRVMASYQWLVLEQQRRLALQQWRDRQKRRSRVSLSSLVSGVAGVGAGAGAGATIDQEQALPNNEGLKEQQQQVRLQQVRNREQQEDVKLLARLTRPSFVAQAGNNNIRLSSNNSVNNNSDQDKGKDKDGEDSADHKDNARNWLQRYYNNIITTKQSSSLSVSTHTHSVREYVQRIESKHVVVVPPDPHRDMPTSSHRGGLGRGQLDTDLAVSFCHDLLPFCRRYAQSSTATTMTMTGTEKTASGVVEDSEDPVTVALSLSHDVTFHPLHQLVLQELVEERQEQALTLFFMAIKVLYLHCLQHDDSLLQRETLMDICWYRPPAVSRRDIEDFFSACDLEAELFLQSPRGEQQLQEQLVQRKKLVWDSFVAVVATGSSNLSQVID
jgi:hypothetical protein